MSFNLPPPPHRLSKSKVAAFEQCPKRLWLQVHRRECGEHDADTLARFKFGHEVGERARLLSADGVLVDTGFDMAAALDWTARLIAVPQPRRIFEATFCYQNVLVRVDILEPDGAGIWHAIEVKGASRVHPSHLADLATQVWVMTGAGLTISRATIRHASKPIDWDRLEAAEVQFCDEDVTSRLGRYISRRPAIVAQAEATIRLSTVHAEMDRRCTQPFACEFVKHCRSEREVPLLARG